MPNPFDEMLGMFRWWRKLRGGTWYQSRVTIWGGATATLWTLSSPIESRQLVRVEAVEDYTLRK